MSFVAQLHADRLDYLPKDVSQTLLDAHADTITRINTALNAGMPKEHRTENIIKTLNDRVEKDIDQARVNHGFAGAESVVQRGMARMHYVPAEHRDTLALLYRVMLQGALVDYAKKHPAYRDTARTQLPEHETGIAGAYAKVTGCSNDDGIDYALSITTAIEAAVATPAR